jgi:glucokinase
MPYYIGVDLGGTKIGGIALNSESSMTTAWTIIPTHGYDGPDAVIERIAGLVKDICQQLGLLSSQLGGVGVGAPASVDMDTGQTLLLPNLPGDWYGKPVGPILHQALGCPVWVMNDARAFTLAEANQGAGRGARSIACFTLGTGIGGGLAIDGRLYLGGMATAGEFGHITIDPNGPICGCGNRGCLEAHASGPAISAMGVKAVLHGATTQIAAIVEHDLNRVTPETIMRAAEAGDHVAQEILQRAGGYLGIGVGNVIDIFSPERVVIGGGVAALGEWIFEPIRRTVRERVRAAPVDKIQIIPAALGVEAGAIGAAIWASQRSGSSA